MAFQSNKRTALCALAFASTYKAGSWCHARVKPSTRKKHDLLSMGYFRYGLDAICQAVVDIAPANRPIALPLATLKAQNLTGELSVGQLTAVNLDVSEVGIPVVVQNDLVRLSNLSARLYQGTP